MLQRIVFVTDLHDLRAFLPAFAEVEAGADLCLVGGDITNFAGAAEARAVLAPLREAFPRLRAVPGNVDRPGVAGLLEEEGLSLHGRGEAMGGLWLSGVGGSNHTPLRAPTEYGEEALSALLRAGQPPAGQGSGVTAPAPPWILITHVPPRDTVADRMFAGPHVGSRALRGFLEEAAPLWHRPGLNLCGHIHEGIGQERVGETLVCNPGAFASGRYARVLVRDGAFRVELCRLSLPRVLRLRARAQMITSKVIGYGRHRLSSLLS